MTTGQDTIDETHDVSVLNATNYMIQIAHVCDCDGQGQAETPLRWQRLRLPEAALRPICKQETAI